MNRQRLSLPIFSILVELLDLVHVIVTVTVWSVQTVETRSWQVDKTSQPTGSNRVRQMNRLLSQLHLTDRFEKSSCETLTHVVYIQVHMTD